jgi:hypothetical protein
MSDVTVMTPDEEPEKGFKRGPRTESNATNHSFTVALPYFRTLKAEVACVIEATELLQQKLGAGYTFYDAMQLVIQIAGQKLRP